MISPYVWRNLEHAGERVAVTDRYQRYDVNRAAREITAAGFVPWTVADLQASYARESAQSTRDDDTSDAAARVLRGIVR